MTFNCDILVTMMSSPWSQCTQTKCLILNLTHEPGRWREISLPHITLDQYLRVIPPGILPQPVSTFSTHFPFKLLPQSLLVGGVVGKVPEHPREHVARGVESCHHYGDRICHYLSTMIPKEIKSIPTVQFICILPGKTEDEHQAISLVRGCQQRGKKECLVHTVCTCV